MEKKRSKSRKVSSSLVVAKAPASFAPMARAHNKLVKLIREMVGMNGIKVTTSEGKIIIENTVAAGAMTQAEFNAMLVTALETAGPTQDAVLDIILAYFPAQTVDACGIGPRDYLTLP